MQCTAERKLLSSVQQLNDKLQPVTVVQKLQLPWPGSSRAVRVTLGTCSRLKAQDEGSQCSWQCHCQKQGEPQGPAVKCNTAAPQMYVCCALQVLRKAHQQDTTMVNHTITRQQTSQSAQRMCRCNQHCVCKHPKWQAKQQGNGSRGKKCFQQGSATRHSENNRLTSGINNGRSYLGSANRKQRIPQPYRNQHTCYVLNRGTRRC